MSNTQTKDYRLKYPEKEQAAAFIQGNRVPFSLAIIGVTYPLPAYYIARRRSDVASIEYIISGEGEIFLDGEWKKACGGDVFVLRPGEDHLYRASAENPWHKLWINYDAEYLNPLFDSFGITSGIYRAPHMRHRFENAEKIAGSQLTAPELHYEIADCVYKIVSELSMHLECAEESDEIRIRNLLDASVYKKTDLDEISETLHISKSTIIRTFKKHFGITPYEYLLNAKTASAKFLLSDTNMSVKQIAAKLCIEDEHYFSALFTKRVGMCPREYRTVIRRNSEHDAAKLSNFS